MDQRVSLVTLGVADTGKARSFNEKLGWSGEPPDGDVVFFQAGGMVVALWGRENLAWDSTVVDGGGWGGVKTSMVTHGKSRIIPVGGSQVTDRSTSTELH